MNIAQAVARFLESHGCSHSFGVSGANIEHLFYALHQRKRVMPVLAKHEASAVNMAEGYFRKTGQPGVVLVTSGAGAFHSLGPLTEALTSQIPMLVIAGQVATQQEGRGGFQDSSGLGTRVDAMKAFAPVTILQRKLRDSDDIGEILDELWQAALEGRGPVVLFVPRDLWEKPWTPQPFAEIARSQSTSVVSKSLGRVMQLLDRARQPVVIVGEDVLFRGYRPLLEKLIRLTGARVALTPEAKGLWDHRSAECVGLVGVMGHESALEALQAADLIVIIGTSLPLMSRPPISVLTGKTIVSLHHSPSFLGYDDPVGLDLVQLVGPVAAMLENICGDQQLNGFKLLRSEPEQEGRAELPSLGTIHDSKSIRMQVAIEILALLHPTTDDVFVDAGNTGAAAIHYFPQRGLGVFSVALGMGGMGHSFGCAIGATFVSRQRSLVIAGDGAFYMYGLEIHTAWQYQLPITFVIFNNNGHAMCHIRESLYLGQPSGDNVFRESQIAQGLAAMMPGLSGFDITSEQELYDILQRFKDDSGPLVLSLKTSPDEMPPFSPFILAQSQQGVVSHDKSS